MKRTKTTLDREPMNSEAIRQRQDFDYILKEATAAKVPIWKSIWFYGPVGIAMVTMVVSAVRINPKNELNDKTTTLSQITLSTDNKNEARTFVVESSDEELTETKSNSNKENVTSEVKETTAPSTTPIIEPAPVIEEPEPVLIAEEKVEVPKSRVPVRKPEPVTEKKTVKTMPSIAGVFNGRVSVAQMCSEGMIHCNNGYEIISYDIQYDNGTGSTVDRVSSNAIPGYICTNLKRYNVGSPVFITKIIAQNAKGERKQLMSMYLEPTF